MIILIKLLVILWLASPFIWFYFFKEFFLGVAYNKLVNYFLILALEVWVLCIANMLGLAAYAILAPAINFMLFTW